MTINDDRPLLKVIPGLFVLLWATGFIGAKYGLPHAGPLSFLAWRFGIVIVILLAISLIMRAPWPATFREATHALISGFLIHGVYLGGVFIAISLGMSAGISALIVGMQPLLTSLLSGYFLGERLVLRHWVGVVLGLLGVGLVLLPKIQIGAGLSTVGISSCVVALFGITLGTIYQKKYFGNNNLRTGIALQYVGAFVPVGMAAWILEGLRVDWTHEFIGALAWLVIVLSLGAITLLILLIRSGEVARVSTLFYLVPPVTALIAFFLFDEQLNLMQVLGMLIAAVAVSICSTNRMATN